MWIANSIQDLPSIARAVMEALGHRRKMAVLGDMGAGKTTFTKAFCAELGIDDPTSSPTFSIINEYAYTDANGTEALLHHLDLYRLKSLEEAIDIGVEDVLYDPWYCIIEWPQIIEPILPEDTAVLRIELMDDGSRHFSLTL